MSSPYEMVSKSHAMWSLRDFSLFFGISMPMVKRMIADGMICPEEVGGIPLFPKETVIDFLDKNNNCESKSDDRTS